MTISVLRGFFVFETPTSLGEGVARILPDTATGIFRALTLSLALHQLKDHGPLVGPNRPIGFKRGPTRPSLNWLEERQSLSSFTPDSPYPNPTVIIIGAGHSGLMLAARLRRLGIVTLIVDKQERLGDSWRKRYHSLVLHDALWGNVFPFLPYPDDWPVFLSKDKVANWMESFASIMELNVWLKSTIEPNSTFYNEECGTWTLTVRTGDGSIRKMKCKHLVQATGHAGEPNVPSFEEEGLFTGSIRHSSAHDGGAMWKGKKAVIIGCGNSAHDIAHDFYSKGATHVTMIQRSATAVVSRDVGIPKLQYAAGYREGGPPTEEVDLSVISFPYKAFEPYAVMTHAAINEEDKELLAGLERVGFKLRGKGSPGLLYQYFRFSGGHYVDVGCSSLIIRGDVKVKQGQVQSFEENGLRLTDGSFLEADVVVLATGYKSMLETCRKIFGRHIADQTAAAWEMKPDSDIYGVWTHSGFPGFWYIGGGILLSRIYSRYVALWIQAIEHGVAPKRRSVGSSIYSSNSY
ncbi:uncharacterized protein EI90DRAFT_3204995 [Cantharellus anzutake]|uniref:uncharacterized protein n=1 Tax=Cantharellus anzutake TaxID=1750568 RepID=UPI001902CB6C|nr:uncharacterized protein EI90DRAFT_3204995 [Cantharellus anzutake]KAF8330178.1 hypothetical protein EI90DRAFT_3204995 [Cantharellus anzutake]